MKSFEIGARDTVVFFLHGLRGHGLAQKQALQHIVKNVGVRVISLEMEGHGLQSYARHCLVPPYQQMVSNIQDEVERHAHDAEQVILVGYSFGSSLMILATQALLNKSAFKPHVAGFIGISTAFDVGHNVPRWQLALSKAVAPLSRFMFEKAWRLSNLFTIHEMNVDLISPDPTVVESIANDPLVFKGRIPLATSAQVYQAGLAARKTIDQLELPCLLVHSQNDTIALPPKAEELGEHVQLRMFKNLRHNCIDGVMREAAISRRTITKFIVDKL